METAFTSLFTVVLLNCVSIGVVAGLAINSWCGGRSTLTKAVYMLITIICLLVPLYYLVYCEVCYA